MDTKFNMMEMKETSDPFTIKQTPFQYASHLFERNIHTAAEDLTDFTIYNPTTDTFETRDNEKYDDEIKELELRASLVVSKKLKNLFQYTPGIDVIPAMYNKSTISMKSIIEGYQTDYLENLNKNQNKPVWKPGIKANFYNQGPTECTNNEQSDDGDIVFCGPSPPSTEQRPCPRSKKRRISNVSRQSRLKTFKNPQPEDIRTEAACLHKPENQLKRNRSPDVSIPNDGQSVNLINNNEFTNTMPQHKKKRMLGGLEKDESGLQTLPMITSVQSNVEWIGDSNSETPSVLIVPGSFNLSVNLD